MIELNATMIAVILNFLFLVWLLNHFLYKPVSEILEGRKQAIARDLGNAEKKLADAEKLRSGYEQKLKDAQSRSQEILKNASSAAEKLKSDAIKAAREESQYMISLSEKESVKMKADAIASAKGDMASLIAAAAGRLIKKKIDEKTDASLIDEMIASIEKTGIN